MSNLIGIRRRIKSAKNISKITKAMEMVAASKMRKAQEVTLAARPYAQRLDEIIGNIGTIIKTYDHPLLTQREVVKKIGVLVVSTNRGLCGSLNTNLFREITLWKGRLTGNPHVSFITAGRRAHSFITRTKQDLTAEFGDIPESPTFESVRPIAKMLMEGYLAGEYDQVMVVYTRFVSTLEQETVLKQILPSQSTGDIKVDSTQEYLFEPSASSILNWVIPYRIELILYQIFLDARASEHSARMVAMKNAHDNAKDLISGLTIDYNRERQALVTNELLDVTTARAALGE